MIVVWRNAYLVKKLQNMGLDMAIFKKLKLTTTSWPNTKFIAASIEILFSINIAYMTLPI